MHSNPSDPPRPHQFDEALVFHLLFLDRLSPSRPCRKLALGSAPQNLGVSVQILEDLFEFSDLITTISYGDQDSSRIEAVIVIVGFPFLCSIEDGLCFCF
ncbi:hypothetical protein PanWU01x14_117580 [Parasponia andersonii]|uniref:Uncharacterized protein n=1 Tax=Parasponia andersonii TaxID=3476 RepID=A0A2P5CWL8_PARAD|nr:hypothetical protein PanWU01x14_117580 [Parasponia andersonii]